MAGFVHILPNIGLKQPSIIVYSLWKQITVNNESESTLKNAGLFQPKFESNMDKPKWWVENLI